MAITVNPQDQGYVDRLDISSSAFSIGGSKNPLNFTVVFNDTSPHTPKDMADSKRESVSSMKSMFRGKRHAEVSTEIASDTSSMSEPVSADPISGGQKHSRFSFHRRSSDDASKHKRESMSDRGAFRVEYSNGIPIVMENKDWPPGVNYKTSSQVKQMQSKNGTPGAFYENQGAIVPGGETAANNGPDPDWVPGLSEEERRYLKSDKSGRYVF